MTSPTYTYRPKDLVAEFPTLEGPARELGLLEEDVFETGVSLESLPKMLLGYFPDARIETTKAGDAIGRDVIGFEDLVKPGPKGRSGTQFREGRVSIHLECVEGQVNAVDVLREFGCMVEMVTTRLLTMIRAQSDLAMRGSGRHLSFSRQVTPGYFLETAGFKFPDHSRGYVNRHAAALQSLAIALLLRTDPRWVFLDLLEASREDAMMLKLLSALAYRSSIDFRDRKELEQYAHTYWRLAAGEAEHYCNVHQVNEAAAYYARQLRSNVRALAV